MRPIKLLMSAFGSYANAENIDFTKFYDKNIFLITGPTGAGKTTIFDGICYALYGHTSSSDKDENYIRSDIADGNTLTYVELDFELKDKKYHIKRSPKQLRKKARGDGYTEQPTEAELQIIDEEKIFTSIKEVDNKIVEIVGLEYEQFRQIIMIPQGEFRQLITAKSKEREDILRKIFGTNEYRKIQEALQNMTNGLREDISKLEEGLKTNIKSISAGDNEVLEASIDKDIPNCDEIQTELINQISIDKKNIEELDKSINNLEKEAKDIQNKIADGKHVNEILQKKSEIEKEKALLDSRKKEIEVFEKSLERGRKASSIITLEENYDNSIEKIAEKERELLNLDKNLEEANKSLNIAQSELDVQLSRNDELDKIKKEIGLYNSFVEKVKSYDTKRKEEEKLADDFKELKEKLEAKGKSIESIKIKTNDLKKKKESLKDCEKNYTKLEIELQKNEDIHKKLCNIIPLIEELQKLRLGYMKENSNYLSIEKQYKELKIEVEKTRRNFIEGYAGKLAKELENEKPCPVCGSIHHPYPAKLIEGVPSEDELNAIEQRLEKLDAMFRKSSDKRNELINQGNIKKELINEKKKETIEALNEDISALEGNELGEYAKLKSTEILVKVNDISSKLDKLQSEIKEEKSISLELTKLEDKKESEDREKEILNTSFTDLRIQLESETKLVQALEKELPLEIRSETGLKSKIFGLTGQVQTIETAIKGAQDNQQKRRDAYKSLSNIKVERGKALIELKGESENFEKKFKSQIIVQGFTDEEEYRSAKLKEDEIKNYDNQIRKHNEDLKSVNDRYKQIIDETKDMGTVDIAELESKLMLKDLEKQSANNKKAIVFSRLQRNEDILVNIKDLNIKISEKGKEYSLVGELSSVANGKNHYKVPFETYVLAAYFEDIIDAANLRLRQMTKNRFQMERIKDQGTGNAFKGLDINILDGNSGQYRSIKNISGGESFKASLSLALGLADVVQSYAGGIKLDTMFIDEGFGSLDSDSLDDAINCLLELQSSGRLVGIISHVKELQERIHSRIEIEPNVDGSKVKYVF